MPAPERCPAPSSDARRPVPSATTTAIPVGDLCMPTCLPMHLFVVIGECEHLRIIVRGVAPGFLAFRARGEAARLNREANCPVCECGCRLTYRAVQLEEALAICEPLVLADQDIDGHPLPRRTPAVRAMDEIMAERQRQEAKWGEQNHSLPHWMLILGEEVGEAHRAVLEREVLVRDGASSHEIAKKSAEARQELVQVAAVTMAILECMDRRGFTREVAEARS